MPPTSGNGLDGFKSLQREFRSLALGAMGAAAAPFAAQLIALSPPWPQGIVLITSILELLSLVLVYQFLKARQKRITNRVMIVGTSLFLVFGAVYLTADSLFTYQTPVTREWYVKGLVCTGDAQLVYKSDCPVLTTADISKANYDADILWTPASLAEVRVSLVSLWLATFVSLAVVLGSFIVFQLGAKNFLPPDAEAGSQAV